LNRPVVRALLTSAAIAAAVALAGCNANDIAPDGRAQAPLSPKTVALIAEKNMDTQSPILVRIFKEEAEMEVWKMNRDGQYALLKTYPICKWSGDLGPKKKEGDRQAPEGFYTITPAQMNPNSNYYLAFNTGFPNAYDRSHNYSGSELMVHGDCSSRGCYAMTDEQILEIYALARESFFGGQKEFQFEAFPFRMTALNMAKHRNNPNFAFWKMLKEGYDDFEATHQEPQVAVCEKRYVFDATSEDGKPIRSNPSGACPAYRLDPAVASTVLDYRRQEQVKMANYISERVATAAPHLGDGGSNPAFAAELAHANVDNSGRYVLASATTDVEAHVPGALPHVPNPPGTTIPKVGAAKTAADSQPAPAAEPAPASQPVVMASVRLPTPAPQPKEGRAPEEAKPANIASLFGNLFSGSHSQAAPAPVQTAEAAPAQPEPAAEQVALRGANTEMAAKPHRVEQPTRVASAPISLQAKPQRVAAQSKQDSAWNLPKQDSVWDQPKAEPKPEAKPAAPKPAAVAKAEPVAKPRVKTASAAKTPPAQAPEPEIRTAYSGTTTGSGLLTGAQPVVPAGSFNSFR
jgi:murein L,D-transpeptidase YafK